MPLRKEDIKYIVVHCSAARSTSKQTLADIDSMHRSKGWSQCGYHFVIRRDGMVEGGRPVRMIGAHAYGYNRVSLGVCLVGGLDEYGAILEGFDETFTEEQRKALTILLDDLQRRYPDAEILGHRDLSPDINGDGIIERWEWLKNCPCFDVRPWVKLNLTQQRR